MSKTMAVLDNNNKVVNIIIVNDDIEDNDLLITYTDNNPAYIDGYYVEGFFYPPQPFPSWTRDNGKWLPPKPYPLDNKFYSWNEEIGNWVEALAL